jgi:hypothetical protein
MVTSARMSSGLFGREPTKVKMTEEEEEVDLVLMIEEETAQTQEAEEETALVLMKEEETDLVQEAEETDLDQEIEETALDLAQWIEKI